MFSNNLIAGAAGQSTGFYPVSIDQSLRFNDDDSAYLSRTPASAGNRKTWTWSGWVKRGDLDPTILTLFSAGTPSTQYQYLYFDGSTKTLRYADFSSGVKYTTAVYRDTSAWMHIVFAYDTTNATASDRIKIFINGSRVTSFTNSSNPTLNSDGFINSSTHEHNIGRSIFDTNYYFDGYLAEVHFTDGTAYDADAFGEFKSGVWVAKTPSVTYGTNGFYLDFANSADIGNDVSGEGNDWTPNNFTASDVVLDSPTDNYPTWNGVNRYTSLVLQEGNLEATVNTTTWNTASATISQSSGKYYAEIVCIDTNRCAVGVVTDKYTSTSFIGNDIQGIGYYDLGYTYGNGGDLQTGLTSFGDGDIIGIALDLDASTVSFYKNNTFIRQESLPSGASDLWTFAVSGYGNGSGGTANFGQSGFTYTPPTGYLALSTANLPEPTISPADDASPEDYFNTVLYTGTGATQSITGVGFQPDWVWLKRRSSSANHTVLDAVRGATKTLETPTTGAEETQAQSLQSFDSDGFTLGSRLQDNQNGGTYVAWNWKANGSAVSNTDGSITSQVSANTESGFSIVSYTGNGTDGATIGHGLGQAPDFIIIKNRDDSTSAFWCVYHSSLFNSSSDPNVVYLNSTQAATDDTNVWGVVDPQFTSDIFTIGSYNGSNGSTDDHIAYCFHSVEGFSKFGSYTGNGSTDGPFVYTGFKPTFLIIKRTDSTASWFVQDNARSPYNAVDAHLVPNLSNAESTTLLMDHLSNGFKCRNPYGEANASGGTYIYMAFAENPFKYSNAR